MLQKAFFKVDVVDRIYDTPVFEKTTPGAYEFTVPEEYNYVVIEYAGAAGQQAVIFGTSQTLWHGTVGNGSIKRNKVISNNSIISGIVGEQPIKEREKSYIGGSGYQSGGTGFESSGNRQIFGGGGGGSTSVSVNGILYTAGGGGGCGQYLNDYKLSAYGGAGGGPNGGAKQTAQSSNKDVLYNGNNATDPNQIGLNSGNGYVKIWAGYDPYFKG